MTAGGGHLEGSLRRFLPLYIGKIGKRAGGGMNSRDRSGKHLRATKMVGHGDQAARRKYVDVGPGPCCLRSARMRADQALVESIRANGGWQCACDRSDRSTSQP